MQIGTSIFLIAVGAILRYGVTGHVAGIRIPVVGLILMLVGVLGLAFALLYMFLVERPRRASAGAGFRDQPRSTRTYR
jgi:Domain of unknown function (DUF6458)